MNYPIHYTQYRIAHMNHPYLRRDYNQVFTATRCRRFATSFDRGNIFLRGDRLHITIQVRAQIDCDGVTTLLTSTICSYQVYETRTQQAVNLLWLISLVFSLASAINSQLAYHWRSAIYRSPRSCVPWWVSIWINRTPLFFLVASVISFSAGLVCFTFSTYHNRPFIPIVITVATSISSFALIAVGSWFAGERYAFSKTRGTKVNPQ